MSHSTAMILSTMMLQTCLILCGEPKFLDFDRPIFFSSSNWVTYTSTLYTKINSEFLCVWSGKNLASIIINNFPSGSLYIYISFLFVLLLTLPSNLPVGIEHQSGIFVVFILIYKISASGLQSQFNWLNDSTHFQ